jgi:predicted nucleotidyltransferase
MNAGVTRGEQDKFFQQVQVGDTITAATIIFLNQRNDIALFGIEAQAAFVEGK